MKQAIIITENQYPCEDAGAIRQHATAKILMELGYKVLVLGYGSPTERKIKTFEGVDYISFRPDSANRWVRAAYRASICTRMMRFLRRLPTPDLILVADVSNTSIIRRLSAYGRKHGCTLVHDSVEWFSPHQFAKGERAHAYRVRDAINRRLVAKGWRVMAISAYLEEHFKKQCDKVARVPVIMDTDTISCRRDVSDGKISLAYVGSPGKKDYLAQMIAGLALLPPEKRENTVFHVVGATKAQLVSICGADAAHIEALGETLVAHGRLPHKEAIDFVKRADFTLLFRDNSLRYARAGFPTKIVESLSSGTPPICNLSSDLGLYLENGKNAFLAAGFAPEDIKDALEKALATSSEERAEMRAAARKTAEEQFDYRHYVDALADLVGEN